MQQQPSDAVPARGLSKTAIWVAAARAIGAREPDPAVRNPDHLAEALLGDPDALGLDHPVVSGLKQGYEQAMQDIEVASTVRAMTERTRFIDAALARAIADGATQVLVLGAGFDSHAYRCRELLAGARIFELDRPVTLAFKQQRVAASLGGPPANLVYVPADLEQEALDTALARHGYDTARRSFVIMEGVSMYVMEEPLRATLRFVAAHAPGSRLVFDFATRPVILGMQHLDPQQLPAAARAGYERFRRLIQDEPWVFGMPVDGEREFLAAVGLTLHEVLTIGSKESVQRFLTRADGSTVGGEANTRALALRRAAQEQAFGKVDEASRAKLEQSIREQERQNAYRIAEAGVG